MTRLAMRSEPWIASASASRTRTGSPSRIAAIARRIRSSAQNRLTAVGREAARTRRSGSIAPFQSFKSTTGYFTVTASTDEQFATHVEVTRTADELPGGGITPFPGRHMIAFYGHPETAALGMMGEQPPAEAVARLKKLVDEYRALMPDQTVITSAT